MILNMNINLSILTTKHLIYLLIDQQRQAKFCFLWGGGGKNTQYDQSQKFVFSKGVQFSFDCMLPNTSQHSSNINLLSSFKFTIR